MQKPTDDQVNALLRVLLAAGGPVAGLLVNWGVPSGQINNILTIALLVLPPLISAIWTWAAHTDAAIVKAADGVPGAKVTVDMNKAAPPVQSVALDNVHNNVTPAA